MAEITDADRAKADECIDSHALRHAPAQAIYAIRDRIARALADAREQGRTTHDKLCAMLGPLVIEACDIDGIVDCTSENPVVRKVLGVLPILADGSVLGGCDDSATVWAVHPTSKEIIECVGPAYWSNLDDWRVRSHETDDDRVVPVSWCYSTSTAAESAATTRTVRVRTVEPMPPITLDDSDLPMGGEE